jgi:hypothetical protein
VSRISESDLSLTPSLLKVAGIPPRLAHMNRSEGFE